MGLLSSKNRGVRYLLCVIDVFTKYAWLKTLKDKKAKTVLHVFIEIVNKSGKKFYNRFMQKGLHDNDIFMHCTHNEGKSIVAGRFISTLKAKIHITKTANDNKSYLSFLNKLMDEYNNIFHRSIGKKPMIILF